MSKILSMLLILLWGSGAALLPVSFPARVPAWGTKVDPRVASAAQRGETEFIIYFTEQANLSAAQRLATKQEKGGYVFRQLVRTARRSQAPVLEMLQERGASYRPYWIANMVWARGDAGLVEAIASRPEVAHLYANPQVRPDLPALQIEALDVQADPVEWNIGIIGAPQVWAAGYTGQGVVVAGQDTGYQWDHPALKAHYLGWDGAQVDHNYHWHDAIHEDQGSDCGFDSPVPCDDRGHGTHTMGTMVGDDPAPGNQVGVAPRAKWIGCRNMANGMGTPVTYSECFQWFLAPTDLAGKNPDPARAPDIVNNSWACTPGEGCGDPAILNAVVEAVRAAGILVVAAAGNSGPDCGTVDAPPAIYPAAFTVGGSAYKSDRVSEISSRGPVMVDGSGRLKPQVVAPAEKIRSSYRFGWYAELSGTSTAAPHAAGLAALLISIDPGLRGEVDRLESLIAQPAQPVRAEEACGQVPGDQIPNNSAGWGRIDAVLSYLELKGAYRLILPDVRCE